jgi:hypothetical protein
MKPTHGPYNGLESDEAWSYFEFLRGPDIQVLPFEAQDEVAAHEIWSDTPSIGSVFTMHFALL